MEPNLGPFERRLRFALALMVLLLATLPGLDLEWRAILVPVAAGLLASAWRRFCPVYTLIGFNTEGFTAPKAESR